MGAQPFMEGDTVENVTQLGGGVVKRKIGRVVSVGARGVQIQFDGPPGLTWMRTSQVQLVEHAKPDAPARVEVKVPKPVAPAPAPKPPPSEDDAEINTWLEMGRGLVSRAEERVHFAREAVASAEEAEALATAAVAESKTALRKAELDLSEVRRRTGEQRK